MYVGVGHSTTHLYTSIYMNSKACMIIVSLLIRSVGRSFGWVVDCVCVESFNSPRSHLPLASNSVNLNSLLE